MQRFLLTTAVLLLVPLSAAWNTPYSQCGNFSVYNGQIYTPGLAIIDAPQPCTPEGGDYLQVAIDISGDGHLDWPDSSDGNSTLASHFYSITLFLTSYSQNKNFTISNKTDANPPLGNILAQESGSTVKHVNWLWPDCLVGNGANSGYNASNARGDYNISIHQAYRLNGSNYYTIFDLPISVSNSINTEPGSLGGNPGPGPVGPHGSRVACAALENPVLNWGTMMSSTHGPKTQPYLGGAVSSGATGSNGQSGQNTNNGPVGMAGVGPAPSAVALLLGFVTATVLFN